MKRSHIYSIRAGYLAVAAVCQVVFSNFPAKFFAFPVNAAIWLLVAGGLWVLQHEKKQTPFANCWVPPHTTFALLALLMLACLVQGFCHRPLTGSWWFVALLSALLCHLWWILLRGAGRQRAHKWTITPTDPQRITKRNSP